MKGEELRKGNYVGCGAIHTGIGRNPDFVYYTVNQITENCAFFKESAVGEYFKDIQPIPITEEWLLKLGFDCWLDNEIKKYYVLHNVIDGTSDFEVTLQDGRAYASIDDNCCCWAKDLYVHQLQNLYYALTGNELTV